jgi:hypothetical protein
MPKASYPGRRLRGAIDLVEVPVQSASPKLGRLRARAFGLAPLIALLAPAIFGCSKPITPTSSWVPVATRVPAQAGYGTSIALAAMDHGSICVAWRTHRDDFDHLVYTIMRPDFTTEAHILECDIVAVADPLLVAHASQLHLFMGPRSLDSAANRVSHYLFDPTTDTERPAATAHGSRRAVSWVRRGWFDAGPHDCVSGASPRRGNTEARHA